MTQQQPAHAHNSRCSKLCLPSLAGKPDALRQRVIRHVVLPYLSEVLARQQEGLSAYDHRVLLLFTLKGSGGSLSGAQQPRQLLSYRAVPVSVVESVAVLNLPPHDRKVTGFPVIRQRR